MARQSKKDVTAPMVIQDNNGSVVAEYPPELLDAIKATVAKGATNEELYVFLQIASQYHLNPLMKEIWFTKFKDEVAIMTSRDGFRKLAMREPTFRKCQSMEVRENDEFEMVIDMGDIANITHKFKQKERGNIMGAYAVLKTIDNETYATYVNFREYDKRNHVWKAYPSAMIKKVAETEVYKSFADISGLNAFESMPSGFRNELAEEEIDFTEDFDEIEVDVVDYKEE